MVAIEISPLPGLFEILDYQMRFSNLPSRTMFHTPNVFEALELVTPVWFMWCARYHPPLRSLRSLFFLASCLLLLASTISTPALACLLAPPFFRGGGGGSKY